MSKTKEEIKQDAEELAKAFGYNPLSPSIYVINVKDAYCIGFKKGASESCEALEARIRELEAGLRGIANWDDEVCEWLDAGVRARDAAKQLLNAKTTEK